MTTPLTTASPPGHSRYRPDIDGLRAIAVIGVLLFHFGADWLSGGFVGVDIFFVISGFVISRSLYREVADGRFSLVAFYERRARRILPALIATMALTSIAAYCLLFDTDLVAYAKSAIASLLFSANLYFYSASGYFAPAAIRIPLLHLWSLGVEEQFYLFFPLIVIGVARWRASALAPVVCILAVASLIACQATRHVNPPLVFYMLPFRAFELLTGCVLALDGVRFPSSRRTCTALVGLGLALIAGSMLLIEETMPFPGLLCVPPCLGAALVIYGGERVTTVGGRLLSTRPFLFIGAISYSLYLVHWPIVVFARLVRSDWEPWAFLAGGLGASIALAYLSYRFVEQPFRHNRTLFTRTRVFAAASVSIVLLISAAVYTVRHDGFPGRVSPDVRRILAYSGYPYAEAFREGTCFLRPDQTGKDLDGSCLPGPRPNLIMWGDSSLAQYYWGLAPLLRQRGISVGQLTASECPPIPTVDRPWRPNCKPFNDFALAQILKARPDIVVVGSVWAGISQEFAALDETIAKLTAAGIRVVVLGPPNIFTRPVPTILAVRRMAGNRDNAAGNDLDAHKSSKRDSMMRAHFQNYKNSNVSYVSVYHATCTPQCQIAVGDMPIHFDDFHLTRQGSELYASKLLPAIVGDQLSR